MNPEIQPIVGDMEPTNQPGHEVPDWQKNIVPGAPAGVNQAEATIEQAPQAQAVPVGQALVQEQPVQQFAQPVVPVSPTMTQAAEASIAPKGSKNYVVTLIFAILFGYYGVDRFYLGKYITGFLKLITGGGLGLWVLIDIYRTGNGKVTAKDGTVLDEYDKYGHIGRPVSKAFVIITFVTLFIFGLFFILMSVSSAFLMNGASNSTVNTESQNQVDTSTDFSDSTTTN